MNYVKDGQKVRMGDPLIGFDRATIQAAGHSDAIAVVVTNADEFSAVELLTSGTTACGSQIIKVTK